MSQKIINVGSTANDGTGDTLRGAFQNVNSNFTELYSNVAAIEALDLSQFAGVNTSFIVANSAFDKANTAWDYANTVSVSANLYADTVGVSANLYADSIVVPAFDKANTAWDYANTINTYVTLIGPYDDDSSAATGGVLLMGLYYTTDGNVKIRLV